MTPDTGRTYPLPAPVDDPRFTYGLLYEVVKVIEQHGYPPIRAGLDLVRLNDALFGFLYNTKRRAAR